MRKVAKSAKQGKTYSQTFVNVMGHKDEKRAQRNQYHKEFDRSKKHHNGEPLTIKNGGV